MRRGIGWMLRRLGRWGWGIETGVLMMRWLWCWCSCSCRSEMALMRVSALRPYPCDSMNEEWKIGVHRHNVEKY